MTNQETNEKIEAILESYHEGGIGEIVWEINDLISQEKRELIQKVATAWNKAKIEGATASTIINLFSKALAELDTEREKV